MPLHTNLKIPTKIAVIVSIILTSVLFPAGLYIISQQGRNLEVETQKKGEILSFLGAKILGEVIEKELDKAAFSEKDIFDTEYVPIPGYDPPKFRTKYDAFLDKLILGLQDNFLRIQGIQYAIAVDQNGYLSTGDTARGEFTIDPGEKDRIGGRTKCILKDEVSLNVTKNNTEGFLQVYNNLAGEIMWDISSPIFVKNKRWGAFRIGYSLEAMKQAQKALKSSLFTMLFAILAVALASTYVLVKMTLAPLTKLTSAASEFADGRLDNKIEFESNDEIGQLADVLERLRVSLKTAMDRLTRKR